MTLSKHEKIAFFIVIALITLLGGFFVFIRPEMDKIKPNQDSLKAVQATLEQKERDFGKETRDRVYAEIREAYEAGKDAAVYFYNEEWTDYDAEEFVRKLLAEVPALHMDDPTLAEARLQLATNKMTINRLTNQMLTQSIYRAPTISNRISEMADIERVAGRQLNPPAEGSVEVLAAQMSNMTPSAARTFFLENVDGNNPNMVRAMREYLSTRGETVKVQTVSFEMPMTESQAYALSMYIYELDKATYISSINFSPVDDPASVSGGAGTAIDDPLNPPDARNPIPVSPVVVGEEQLRNYTVNLSLFIVDPMGEPVVQLFDLELWN